MRARLRRYAAILVMAYMVAAMLRIVLAHGLVDRNNKPIGDVYAVSTPSAGRQTGRRLRLAAFGSRS